jgi:hypothetical protein
MAKDKPSFLLYRDIIHMVRKLPNEKAGELFKHILAYVNDENPETEDSIIDIAFEPIKQSLKRDLKRYEETRERNRLAGIASADARKQKSTRVNGRKQLSTKSTDSGIGIDSDIELRKKEFYKRVAAFKERYPKELLRAFYEKWTELNHTGKKMAFELQKTFEVDKRLITWKNNEPKFNKGQKPAYIPTKPKASLDNETAN